MVDIITQLQKLNWDGITDNILPQTGYMSAAKQAIDTNESFIPNNTDNIGLFIEADKSEDSKILEYTKDDEEFKTILDRLFDEEEEEAEDEQVGNDFEDLVMSSIYNQGHHDKKYDITQIEGTGGVVSYGQSFGNFDINSLLYDDEDEMSLQNILAV